MQLTNQATRIRLRDLSDELGIDTDRATTLLKTACAAHTGRPPRKPFGPSTVIGQSLAARVRALATRPPTADTDPSPPADRPTPPAAPAASPAPEPISTSTLFLAPGAQPPHLTRMPAPRPPAPAAHPVDPPATVDPPPAPQASEIPVADPDWARRGIDPTQRESWIKAGLKPTDAALAEQCVTAGIQPDQLSLRLSGQSALGRLRGGEPATSVWARLQENEQRGRGPGRLQGRFA